jgi:hypothetical protein
MYDPKKFDLSKQKRPYNEKIVSQCQEKQVFYDYKRDGRNTLEKTILSKQDLQIKRKD